MHHSPAFLALIGELERFQLPFRRRLQPGEIMSGRMRSNIMITPTAHGHVVHPLIVAHLAAAINVRTISAGDAFVQTEGRLLAKIKIKAAIRGSRAPKAVATRATGTRKGQPRSQEAIERASAALRAHRLAHEAKVLPLVHEAVAAGCETLEQVCAYLNKIGCKPRQSAKWSTGSLSKIAPALFPIDREKEAERIRDLIAQAIEGGAVTNAQVAAWLNAHGHRTTRLQPWTRGNVSRIRC